jgi:putative flippase GtrA
MANNKRPIIFLGVGIFNTLFDFGIYTLLTTTAFKDGKHIALVGILSGTFALLCAFLTHSFITWRGSQISNKTVSKFVLFTGFGMWMIRPLLLSAFIKLHGLYNWTYHFSHGLHLSFSRNFIANTGAFGFMTVILLAYNYFVYARFVFAKPKPTED